MPTLDQSLLVILGIIVVALVFDFLNGFHDAANSIATIVTTRVLSPTQAVLWAAFFNFVAAFVFGTKVATTIAKHLVNPDVVDINVVFAGLMGAIIWNIITWWLGLPTSSSHALVSGLAGAAIAKAGIIGVILWKGWSLILLGLVLSPTLGLLLGAGLMIAVSWLFQRFPQAKVNAAFRKLQLVSAGIYSLGHGGNDAQKTMGIIVMLLVAAGHKDWATWGQFQLPWIHHDPASAVGMPIILLCHLAIALGTVFGGWRIVKTMGSRITHLKPVHGFCAETAAATAIIGFTNFGGVPISTTHAITGAILGVGSVRGLKSVRWVWGQRIITAWILTIPCSAAMAAIIYGIVRVLG